MGKPLENGRYGLVYVYIYGKYFSKMFPYYSIGDQCLCRVKCDTYFCGICFLPVFSPIWVPLVS